MAEPYCFPKAKFILSNLQKTTVPNWQNNCTKLPKIVGLTPHLTVPNQALNFPKKSPHKIPKPCIYRIKLLQMFKLWHVPHLKHPKISAQTPGILKLKKITKKNIIYRVRSFEKPYKISESFSANSASLSAYSALKTFKLRERERFTRSSPRRPVICQSHTIITFPKQEVFQRSLLHNRHNRRFYQFFVA